MGIVPRYRYILVTDALMSALSTEELESVLAHEMGHARYFHLLFYVLFFVGFMVISFRSVGCLYLSGLCVVSFGWAHFGGGRPVHDAFLSVRGDSHAVDPFDLFPLHHGFFHAPF
jgi:hypothetical protein